MRTEATVKNTTTTTTTARMADRFFEMPADEHDEVLDLLGRYCWLLLHSVCGEAYCEYRRPLRCDDPGLRGVSRTSQEEAANDLARTAAGQAARMVIEMATRGRP